MDSRRFDALTRGLATRSRRQLLRAVLVAASTAVTGAYRRSSIASAHQVTTCIGEVHPGSGANTCPWGECRYCTAEEEASGIQRCSSCCSEFECPNAGREWCCIAEGGVRRCIPHNNSPFSCGAPCNVCGPGEDCCSGSCIGRDSNFNCGGNCNRCPIGSNCVGGSCDCNPPCTSDYPTCCNGSCADLNTTPIHCGSCDIRCEPSEWCCHGTCADLLTDPRHCGACGNACRAFEGCCSGRCVDFVSEETCGGCNDICGSEPPLTCCRHSPTAVGVGGGVRIAECFDLNNDELHCGECTIECRRGRKCCHGTCVDIRFDRNNCNDCDRECDAGKSCCMGNCDNLRDSPFNCGECSHVCPEDQPCCDGTCRNIRRDELHCGECFHECDADETCVDGDCRAGE
jgi:hypothetical protein